MRIRAVEDMWPFSDTVYVLTSAPSSEVSSWVKFLSPDVVYDSSNRRYTPDWPSERRFVKDIEAGMRIVYVWWD